MIDLSEVVKTAGIIYFTGVILVALTIAAAFYYDRKESGIPMVVAAPLAIVAGLFWPVMVWMLLDEWLGFPLAPKGRKGETR